MATLAPPGQKPEAEPVLLECYGETLILTLDSGVEVWLSLKDFQRALNGELAPISESEAA
ncbi:MAG: hypothetical protein M3355_11945 [Actinomycetota bacterium]|nr:hypothetical protein [Actinomycetota bacterium]